MTSRFETKLVGSDRHSYRELFKRAPGNPILTSRIGPMQQIRYSILQQPLIKR